MAHHHERMPSRLVEGLAFLIGVASTTLGLWLLTAYLYWFVNSLYLSNWDPSGLPSRLGSPPLVVAFPAASGVVMATGWVGLRSARHARSAAVRTTLAASAARFGRAGLALGTAVFAASMFFLACNWLW